MSYNVELQVVNTPPQQRKPIKLTLYAEYQPGEQFTDIRHGEWRRYEVLAPLTLRVKEAPLPCCGP